MTATAAAPASSGNLGPGFDAIALALELRCRVTVEVADEWTIVERGVESRPDLDDLVVRAVLAAVDRPMRMTIDNDIPPARGLGSSAAVAAAAAHAAIAATGGDPELRTVFEIVCRLEGHADNAAATVFGGAVAVLDGRVRSLPVASAVRVLVAMPDTTLPTVEARRALPEDVPLAAASRNLARAVFLVEGLRTGEAAAFAGARGDELHEPHRASLSPITGELIEVALDAGALHAGWSGAGPSVVCFVEPSREAMVAETLLQRLEGRGSVRGLDVATTGVH